jgi:hypothetical protein
MCTEKSGYWFAKCCPQVGVELSQANIKLTTEDKKDVYFVQLTLTLTVKLNCVIIEDEPLARNLMTDYVK